METAGFDPLAERFRRAKQIKCVCSHCFNEALLDFACFTQAETAAGDQIEHRMYRCTLCQGVVLFQTTRRLPADYVGSKQPRFSDAARRTVDERQLWPAPVALSPEAPQRVAEFYQEALVVRRSPSAFVVQIGRALEALARDRRAQGKDLFEKLGWLVSNEHLPDVFGRMAHVDRVFRNWGAHDIDVELTQEDADIADGFFRAIVEYLYVAPAKVQAVQSLIASRKNKA